MRDGRRAHMPHGRIPLRIPFRFDTRSCPKGLSVRCSRPIEVGVGVVGTLDIRYVSPSRCVSCCGLLAISALRIHICSHPKPFAASRLVGVRARSDRAPQNGECGHSAYTYPLAPPLEARSVTSARAARIFSSMEMKVPETVRLAPSSKKATARWRDRRSASSSAAGTRKTTPFTTSAPLSSKTKERSDPSTSASGRVTPTQPTGSSSRKRVDMPAGWAVGGRVLTARSTRRRHKRCRIPRAGKCCIGKAESAVRATATRAMPADASVGEKFWRQSPWVCAPKRKKPTAPTVR
mmetsp:Transcript_7586/g.24346  ORF Transcript_7586/g.24346 Transcript_7586/m.24346 type:complete len:293 (-) Transcript_7586:332-1210(-)